MLRSENSNLKYRELVESHGGANAVTTALLDHVKPQFRFLETLQLREMGCREREE